MIVFPSIAVSGFGIEQRKDCLTRSREGAKEQRQAEDLSRPASRAQNDVLRWKYGFAVDLHLLCAFAASRENFPFFSEPPRLRVKPNGRRR